MESKTESKTESKNFFAADFHKVAKCGF